MQIPDHLVDVVRELAREHLLRVLGAVRVIEAHRSLDHPDSVEARRRLRDANELCEFLGCNRRAAA